MSDCASCSGCSGCGGGCGGCGRELLLSPEELRLLQRFAQVPFLPAVQDKETGEYHLTGQEAYSDAALVGLKLKGLVEVDGDIPLKNYAYQESERGYCLGSAALTAKGQQIIERLELQGVE